MSTPERITDYASLKNAVGRFADIESNAKAVLEVPTFVQLAEADIATLLKIRLAERTSDPLVLNADDRVLPLPVGFVAMQDLRYYEGEWPDGELKTVMKEQASQHARLVLKRFNRPTVYEIIGQELTINPPANTIPAYLIMRYWRTFQALGTPVESTDKSDYAKDVADGGSAFNGLYTRNGLLDRAPHLYLYMSLMHAGKWLRNEPMRAENEAEANRIAGLLEKDSAFARSSGASNAPLLAGGTP